MLKFLVKNLHQSWFIVAVCAGIIIGVIVGLVLRINYFMSPLWIVFIVLILVFIYLVPKFVFIGLALIVGMIIAFFRVSSELFSQDYVRQFYGQTVLVEGEIDGDPETSEDGTRFRLNKIILGKENETSGTIFVSTYKNESLNWGDRIVLSGKLSEGFGTYVGYMYRPMIMEWDRPEPGNLFIRVRNFFAERISRLIRKPEVSLGLSYLLGMKSGLPDDLDEQLRMIGLVHIVVASGAHLSILVEIARKIFGKISRFSGFLFSILFVIFFMAMIGWTPSIMRAGIMSILTLSAWRVGRKIEAWRIILLVAAFTLLLNPNYIMNLGWLLSFASYGGIMILGPSLCKFFYGDKKPKFISSIVLTTIAATLMTLPIILYYYGTISLISLLANLLILPTLPYAMGLVFLTGVVSGIPGVETAVSFLATKLLDFHIFIVRLFSSLKQFLIKIDAYQIWVFGIYGLIIIAFFVSWLRRKKENKRM